MACGDPPPVDYGGQFADSRWLTVFGKGPPMPSQEREVVTPFGPGYWAGRDKDGLLVPRDMLTLLPSRIHDQDHPGKVDLPPGAYERCVVSAAPADALLPPDQDAFGSLHCLQIGEQVMLARWTESGWYLMEPEDSEGFLFIQAPEWRYHSQFAFPAPLPAPEAPDVERMWAAVQDLGKR